MGIGRRPGNAGKHGWPAAEGRAEQGSLTLEAFLFISWCFSILASGFRDSAREGRCGAIVWYVLLGSAGTSLGKHASPQAQLLRAPAFRVFAAVLQFANRSAQLSLYFIWGRGGRDLPTVLLLPQDRAMLRAETKLCPSAELPAGQHVMGLTALCSSAGTGGAGARLCATRPWMYPGALISLHPFEWKLFGALLCCMSKLCPNLGTGFWVMQ